MISKSIIRNRFKIERFQTGSSLFPVGRGGLDGWRMMAIDDTGTDLWTVAGAWEELEGGGVVV